MTSPDHRPLGDAVTVMNGTCDTEIPHQRHIHVGLYESKKVLIVKHVGPNVVSVGQGLLEAQLVWRLSRVGDTPPRVESHGQ